MPRRPLFPIALQGMRLLLDLAITSVVHGDPQDLQLQVTRHRFAFRVHGRNRDLEWLTGQIDFADRRCREHESGGREVEWLGDLQIPLGQRNDQPQRLRFTIVPRRQLEPDQAFFVRGGREHATVSQLILDLPIRQWSAVVILGFDGARNLLAAIIDRTLGVDRQADGVQLIVVNLKHTLVVLFALIKDTDSILALRTTRRQSKMHMKGAELGEFRLLIRHQPIACIEDFDLVFFPFLNLIGVATHLPQHATHMDQVPRSIGRSIGVDITARRQPLGHSQTFQVNHVGCAMVVHHGKHAHIFAGLQLRKRLVKYAIVARLPLPKHLLAIRHQHPHLRPRFARSHVLSKNEEFVA